MITFCLGMIALGLVMWFISYDLGVVEWKIRSMQQRRDEPVDKDTEEL